jgi:cytochrome c-type biogenesis protein CcmF
MTASAAWKGEAITVLRPGESVELARYSYRLEGVEQRQGPNYSSDTATFTVTRDGRPVAVLTPEKRLYPVQNMPTTEAAIHTTGLRDLYAVIGDPDGTGGWTVRIYHEPLLPWLWVGCLLMVLGGAVSLSDRRLRIGAPSRRAKPAAVAEA